MEQHPRISILVPSYKAARFLGPLCQSIQAQTLADFEVLIADDGSPDNTAEAVAPFLRDARFRFFSWQPNRGVARATLTLLTEARGEFWCNPGADDLLKPDFLAARIEALERHPQAILAHGPPTRIDPEGRTLPDQPLPIRLAPCETGPHFLAQIVQHNFINTPSIMARMSATRLVLPFFSTCWQYQDWFLWILLASLGMDFLHDPQARHCYRVHPESLTGDPAREATRSAEDRLTPMCALSTAAKFSGDAALLWARWRRSLYALWLRRALALRQRHALQDSWLQLAGQAFYHHRVGRVHLWPQLARWWPEILAVTLRERRARRRQTFVVSGLALVDAPMFRRP
jgi:glycosyltransferase involved in cell wall biosynthesis